MRARSANTGVPEMFLPSASGSAASVVRNASEFEQLAQEHLLAPRVGQLDADGVAPGDRGGTHAGGPHRAGEVVGEPDHARRLDAARRLELVERDDGTGVHVLDLALDAEVGEHVAQQPRLAAQLGLREERPRPWRRLGAAASRAAGAGRRPRLEVRALGGRGHVRGWARGARPRRLAPRRRRERSAWRSRGSCARSGDRTTHRGPCSACPHSSSTGSAASGSTSCGLRSKCSTGGSRTGSGAALGGHRRPARCGQAVKLSATSRPRP